MSPGQPQGEQIEEAMMAKSDATELDTEQLMLRIRESAAKRKLTTGYSSSQSGAWAYPPLPAGSQSYFEADLPELKLTPEFKTNKDNHYHLNDLLKLHDRQFVRSAYRAILKREPDDEGFRGYLERLRSGHRNKIDILASLRFSAEGRQKKVRVDGLGLPAAVRVISRVPILGYFLQLMIGILRMPASIRERRRFESYSIIQQQEAADHINRLGGVVRALSRLANELPSRMDQQQQQQTALLDQQQQQLKELLTQQTQELTSVLQQQQRKVASQDKAILSHANSLRAQENSLRVQEDALTELSRAAAAQKKLGEGLNAQLLDNQKTLRAQSEAAERLAFVLQQVRLDLAMQQARTASLINAVNKDLAAPSREQVDVFSEEDAHMMDALYVSLEDHFRGDKSELKLKFEFYLPYLEQAGIRKDILDIGCGRGEWLELLKEGGLQAKGVDVNRAMAEQCREAGLEIFCVNAIDYLRSLPDNSLGAITSFHVIEHLDFKVLVELIDESIRTLKHDGLLIFETPNPENVLVASCNFYLDPSHRRPLPSQVIRFLLEARGLTDLEVVNLHPLDAARINGDTELTHRFNDIFYGPMDYAVIARKI